MKVWIIDEGKYPSGFAGGKFSQERPDLRMQALVIGDTIQIKRGEVMTNHKIAPEIISAVAVSTSGAPNRTVEINNGKISFNAGLDDWKILLVKSDFRTAVTRAVNNPNGGKDATNSLCDYLNPVAVQQFIDWTHKQYKNILVKSWVPPYLVSGEMNPIMHIYLGLLPLSKHSKIQKGTIRLPI